MTTNDPFGTVPLEDLTVDLGYEFMDLSTAALVHYLRRAAIIMCRDGDLVTQRVRVATQPNVRNYALEPSDDTELTALLDVRCMIPGLRRAVIRTLHEPPHAGSIFCDPAAWFVPPEELFIEANFEGEYEALFSVAPRRDACSIPAVLRDRWYETLLCGARYLLHDSSGKPWSDRELAARLGAEFRNSVRRAKVESMTGFQRGVLRMNTPRVM